MDENLFKEGKPFEVYAESSDLDEAYECISISAADEEFFSSITVKVVCISEHWCGDCRREVPLIAHVADNAGWDFRIFGKDQIPGLMDHYATDGKKRIPVFVFFDETFTEVGRFIEKAPEGKTTLDVLKEMLQKGVE